MTEKKSNNCFPRFWLQNKDRENVARLVSSNISNYLLFLALCLVSFMPMGFWKNSWTCVTVVSARGLSPSKQGLAGISCGCVLMMGFFMIGVVQGAFMGSIGAFLRLYRNTKSGFCLHLRLIIGICLLTSGSNWSMNIVKWLSILFSANW